jgi:hypothetical protein
MTWWRSLHAMGVIGCPANWRIERRERRLVFLILDCAIMSFNRHEISSVVFLLTLFSRSY